MSVVLGIVVVSAATAVAAIALLLVVKQMLRKKAKRQDGSKVAESSSESPSSVSAIPVTPPRSTTPTRGRKLFNSLKCVAAPGCGSQKRDSMLPEEGEIAYQRISTPMAEPPNRQDAIDRSIESVVEATENTTSVFQEELPLPMSSTSFDIDSTAVPSWDMQGVHGGDDDVHGGDDDEVITMFSADWETDVANPLKEAKRRRQLQNDGLIAPNQREETPLLQQPGQPADTPPPNVEMKEPRPRTPDWAPDDNVAPQQTTTIDKIAAPNDRRAPTELDLALARQLGFSKTAAADASTQPTRMDEIMEQAKVRKARLEHAQNRQAREPPVADSVTANQEPVNVQHLMNRIDKLSKYLQCDDAWEAPSSVTTGVDTTASSTDMHYHDILVAPVSSSEVPRGGLDATNGTDQSMSEESLSPSSPDRGLPPSIQPSVSCQATTLRPLFWRSYPKKIVQSPPTPKRSNGQQQQELRIIDTLPTVSPSVPTTSTASLVVLTPRRYPLGHSLPTVTPPSMESKTTTLLPHHLSKAPLSPAQQRIASRAATARFEESFSAIPKKTTKSVSFPDVPPRATLFEDEAWISGDESNEWSEADAPWAKSMAESPPGEQMMAEI